MRSVFILSCLAFALSGSAAPATTAASRAEVNARAAHLIEEGYAALRGGDAQAALESFLDVKTFWSKQGVRTDVNDPLIYADIAGMGAAYLALGHNDKANDPLDRAYAATHREKSLIVNRAALDYIQHVNLQRGTRELVDLLSRPDAEADEASVNVLGACVQYSMLDSNLARGALYAKASDLYAKLNGQLEAKRPGERRWGMEWMSDADFKVKAATLQKARDQYQAAVATRDAAAADLAAANAELDRVRRQVGLRPSEYQQGQIDAANAKVNRAGGVFVQARDAVPVAFKAIVWPEWPKTFPPELPLSAGGGLFGSPALTAEPAAPKPEVVAIAITPTPRAEVTPQPDASTPPVPVEVAPPKPAAPPPPLPHTISRYAVAFAVAPDLLLTAASSLDGATDFVLENAQGESMKATVLRSDAMTGLALLRVDGKQFRYLNLAPGFNGGDVTCWGFPDVSIFNPVSDSIAGKALSAKADKWTVSLRRHPRLPGGPLVDKSNALIGVELGERDAVMTQIRSIKPDDIRKFLADDAPKATCANPDPAAVWQVTASRVVP